MKIPEEVLKKYEYAFYITCGVCGKRAIAFYNKEYRGYLAECKTCGDQWKLE